jgi:hypothetical protein
MWIESSTAANSARASADGPANALAPVASTLRITAYIVARFPFPPVRPENPQTIVVN